MKTKVVSCYLDYCIVPNSGWSCKWNLIPSLSSIFISCTSGSSIFEKPYVLMSWAWNKATKWILSKLEFYFGEKLCKVKYIAPYPFCTKINFLWFYCWGQYLSLSHRLSNSEGNETKEFSFPPLEKTPPVLTGPLWWPQPLLEVELWPSIGQETKWPTAPLRRGPSHLPGIISKPPTWILCFSNTLKTDQDLTRFHQTIQL